MTMNNLASMLRDLGRLDEAIPLLKKTVQIMTEVRNEEHAYTKVACKAVVKPLDSKKMRSSLYTRIKEKLRRKESLKR